MNVNALKSYFNSMFQEKKTWVCRTTGYDDITQKKFHNTFFSY